MSTDANPSPVRWCVWEDWANDDVLAIEAGEMTPALRTQLTHERIPVKEVDAPDRHAAVRQAFPHRFQPPTEQPTTPVRSRTPRMH